MNLLPGSFVTGFIQNKRKLSSSGSFSFLSWHMNSQYMWWFGGILFFYCLSKKLLMAYHSSSLLEKFLLFCLFLSVPPVKHFNPQIHKDGQKSRLGACPICSLHCSLVTLFQLNSVSYRDFLGCMWLTLSTMVWWHPFLLFCIYTRLLTAYHSASLLVAYTPQEKILLVCLFFSVSTVNTTT